MILINLHAQILLLFFYLFIYFLIKMSTSKQIIKTKFKKCLFAQKLNIKNMYMSY